MRDSAALKVVESLLAKGVKSIRAYDPLAMVDAQKYWFNPSKNHLFERISYHDSAKEAIAGSDALYISTDWEEFRGLAHTIQATVQPPFLVIDGRRMIPDFSLLVDNGYEYLAVGGTLQSPETRMDKSENGQVPTEASADLEIVS